MNRLGHEFEAVADGLLWSLVRGDVQLWHITPALAGFYGLGHNDGRASRQPEVDQAQADADRYYRYWQNPGKQLDEFYQKQIDVAGDEVWARIQAQFEQYLRGEELRV